MITNSDGTVHQMTMYWEAELRAPFLRKYFLFYTVDGLKGDLIICFDVLTLLCKDHANTHVALN